jgi:hypothetical protein
LGYFGTQQPRSIIKTVILDKLYKNISNSISEIIIYVILFITSFSCQRNIKSEFERTRIVINDQQFEIITRWKILDDYIGKKPGYKKYIFQRIIYEFNYDTEYPFLFDATQEKIEPNDEFRQAVELIKDIDFIRMVDSTYQIVSRNP